MTGSTSTRFPVWKTIKLGTYQTIDAIRNKFIVTGMRICISAESDLKKIPLGSVETEVDLVLLSHLELGFPDSVANEQIDDRRKELGLERCSFLVGPELRLQYPDQPIGEELFIAMEPSIGEEEGYPCVFVVHHGRYHEVAPCNAGLWLASRVVGLPRYVWDKETKIRWVFVQPRQDLP